MRTAFITFGASLAAGALLTPVARRFAFRVGAIDHALSSRKVHAAPLPRLGGIAIVAAFFAPLISLVLLDPTIRGLFLAYRGDVIALAVGGAAIAALGVYDDLNGTRARTKFAVQFAVAAFVYHMGYRIDAITSPFGAPVQLGWCALPFTMLWIVGVINAINLIDGLDGLAGGVAFIAVGTTFVTAVLQGDVVMTVIAAALGGAVLGFLRYNFNPASIFMGDTGSMFLGFVLATSAIHSRHKSSTAIALLVPILSLAVPITDTLLAIVRRYVSGAPLFHGDREHIHHRLLALGLSHRRTVLVLYGASFVCAGVAFLLTWASAPLAALALATFAAGATVVLRQLGYLKVERISEILDQRRRNLQLRANLREVAARLKRASEAAEVWDTVKEAAPGLGARGVALRIISKNARGHERTHRFVSDACADAASLRTEHTLLVERPGAGVLELDWGRRRSPIDRDTERAVELLCHHVHRALVRVATAPPLADEAQATQVVAAAVDASRSVSEAGARGRIVAQN